MTIIIRYHRDVVPFDIVCGVRVHPQLGAGQTNTRHLVLQRIHAKCSGNNVMQQ